MGNFFIIINIIIYYYNVEFLISNIHVENLMYLIEYLKNSENNSKNCENNS